MQRVAAGPVTARSDEAFAIFKIEGLDNTKSSKSFVFDPTHLPTRARLDDAALRTRQERSNYSKVVQE
jgi:hypothetical protein